MRITRIFHPLNSDGQTDIVLSKDASHHLLTVLRLPVGAELELFDGSGFHYPATIIAVDKKEVRVNLEAKIAGQTTSKLGLHLGQVISRGEKMDFTIQKRLNWGWLRLRPYSVNAAA